MSALLYALVLAGLLAIPALYVIAAVAVGRAIAADREGTYESVWTKGGEAQ